MRRTTSMGLALGLATLVLYAPAVTHEFLTYDDQQYVTENQHIQAGPTRTAIAWAFTTYYASNWHPLTWLSHMLDCRIYGVKPAGHHATNVLLHTANTVLLFLLLRRLTGRVWPSAAVAALFGWHPLHAESVAWVSERKDVLCALFWLLTIWAYSRYAEDCKAQSRGGRAREPEAGTGHPRVWYGLALLMFALGLMSKPMIVTLPVVLWLLDYWPLRRSPQSEMLRPASGARFSETSEVGWWRLLAEKLPFLGMGAIGCALTLAAQRQGYAMASIGSLSLSKRIAHAVVSYVHYLGAMVVPRHLAVYYPYPAREGWIEVLGAAVLLVMVSVPAFRCASRRPSLTVGWLWYLVTLVPVVGLVQVGNQAWADRYTYLPLIGIFIALVWAVADWAGGEAVARPGGEEPKGALAHRLEPAGRRWALPAAGAGLAVGLMALTSVQLEYWKNTRTLFEHTAQVTQENARAITVLGSLLAGEGKLEDAMAFYRQALGYDATSPETHFSMARALEQQGHLDEAVAEYTQVLWYRPLQEQAHIFIGVALAKQKRYGEAAAHYRAALEVNPESAVAHNNLARLLHTEGRFDDAIVHYSAALKSDAGLAEAHNNLGILLLQKGRAAEGAVQLRDALRLKPGDTETQLNLAQALVQQGEWREAAELFAKTVTAATTDPNVHYQFATALAHLRQTRQAMSQYASALLLQQDFPAALDGLAWILATDDDPQVRNGDQAYAMAERACALTGRKDPEKLKTLAAACAESGRFSQAVFDAQAALELASKNGQERVVDECRLMLGAFRAGRSWREPR